MFGTRESFTYLQCGGCGTVQLLDVPADLAPHYPPDYYSFNTKVDIDFTGWKRRLGAWAVANYYGRRRNVLGRYLAATREWAPQHFPPSIVDFNVDITDAITHSRHRLRRGRATATASAVRVPSAARD